MSLDQPPGSQNPPVQFYLRFPEWALGRCFKCETYKLVACLGDLTVDGFTIKLFACHPCAWRLEQFHRALRRRHDMAHDLIAAPFLGSHVVLRPGRLEAIKLPERRFRELELASARGEACPPWLLEAAKARWGGQPAGAAGR